jgi:hypothetical protein
VFGSVAEADKRMPVGNRFIPTEGGVSIPVGLDVQTKERLPEPVEVAAYYVVSEALANAICLRGRITRTSQVHDSAPATGKALEAGPFHAGFSEHRRLASVLCLSSRDRTRQAF